jgi:hypothetical protein
VGHKKVVLLTLFPTWSRAFSYFFLGWQSWQKHYCLFLDGDLYCPHCPHHPSTSTHALRNCFVCDNHLQHDELHGSFCCCSSKSKNRSKSKKEISTKSDSFFWTKCPCLKRRNVHCAQPLPFFRSDSICNHHFSQKAFLDGLFVAMMVIVAVIIVVVIVVLAVNVITLVGWVIVMALATMVLVV